jgi:uncharacterized protein (TIGR00252 family)
MDTTSLGRSAETLVAEYMQGDGYKLVAQNWRTRWCEIDLVMTKKDTVYFVEVKYRKSANYGDPFEYITPKKLRQMEFAAKYWLGTNAWKGESTILAASLTGAEISPLIVDVYGG